MAEVTSTQLKYTNFKVNKKGLYESSRTPKEGFIEVKYGDKLESTTYHRYVDGLIGRISSIRISKPEFGGTYLNLVLVDGQEAYTISTALYASNANYSFTARLILDSLSKADFSKKVQLSFWTKKVDENEYQNMTVFYHGEKTDDGKNVYVDRVMFDEKPKREYKEVGGESKLIVEPHVEFYYNILTKMQETLQSLRESRGGSATSSTNSEVSTPKPEEKAPKDKLTPAMSDIDESDLPF